MMDKRYRRDASGLCCRESSQEVKVYDDDISRMTPEFVLDMGSPHGRGQKPAGQEYVNRECLGCPSP